MIYLRNSLRTLRKFFAARYYWAVKLDPASKETLLKAFPPVHATVYGDHMTLAFNPPLDAVARLESLEGLPVTLSVVGYAEDDKGQAVVVSSPIARTDGGIEHVTISCNGIGPRYSNDLLGKGFEEVVGPTLTGVIMKEPLR